MSCGSMGQGESASDKSAEEAPRGTRGKQSAWNENQQPNLTEASHKKAKVQDYSTKYLIVFCQQSK
jgi:hypothetical protein